VDGDGVMTHAVLHGRAGAARPERP
jgi:hypothetical protein